MKPYNILLDQDVVDYIIDQQYLINIETGSKEEVLWAQAGLIAVQDKWYTGEQLLEKFTFINGSPCGFIDKNDFCIENIFSKQIK